VYSLQFTTVHFNVFPRLGPGRHADPTHFAGSSLKTDLTLLRGQQLLPRNGPQRKQQFLPLLRACPLPGNVLPLLVPQAYSVHVTIFRRSQVQISGRIPAILTEGFRRLSHSLQAVVRIVLHISSRALPFTFVPIRCSLITPPFGAI
jgi:hypothetical protein